MAWPMADGYRLPYNVALMGPAFVHYGFSHGGWNPLAPRVARVGGTYDYFTRQYRAKKKFVDEYGKALKRQRPN